jgi:hypothetical protein
VTAEVWWSRFIRMWSWVGYYYGMKHASRAQFTKHAVWPGTDVAKEVKL